MPEHIFVCVHVPVCMCALKFMPCLIITCPPSRNRALRRILGGLSLYLSLRSSLWHVSQGRESSVVELCSVGRCQPWQQVVLLAQHEEAHRDRVLPVIQGPPSNQPTTGTLQPHSIHNNTFDYLYSCFSSSHLLLFFCEEASYHCDSYLCSKSIYRHWEWITDEELIKVSHLTRVT